MEYILYYVNWRYRQGAGNPADGPIIWPDRYESGTEPDGHWNDEHCTVDEDGQCGECGVSHTGDCPICGGKGFHTFCCRESEREDGIYPIPVPYAKSHYLAKKYLEAIYGERPVSMWMCRSKGLGNRTITPPIYRRDDLEIPEIKID